MLDLFALIILLIIIVALVACVILLGMLPGKIAKSRNHPQAEAITVCGWWGILTMGILLPFAFIWAYTIPQNGDERSVEQPSPANVNDEEGSE